MYKKLTMVLLSVAAIDSVHATSSALQSTTINTPWFVGIEVGALWPNTPSVMTVANGSNYPSPYNVDRYSADLGSDAALSAMLGYQWHRQTEWIPAYTLALRYQHLMANDLAGEITQYSSPEFLNYDYRWNVHSDLLSLYSKIDIHQYGDFTPFVDLGLGLALNHSGRYQETAKAGVTPRISPAYQSHSQSEFAYNLGFGIDYALAAQWRVSVSYDYQNLGRFQSANGVSTWSAERLNMGEYKANTLSAGVTYYFDSLMPNK